MSQPHALSRLAARADLPRWLGVAAVTWLGAIVALLAILLGIGFVWYERGMIEAREVQSAELYARVLQDHADRSFATIEVALAALDDTAIAVARDRDAAAHQAELSHAQQGMPLLRSVSVMDATGLVLASSVPGNIGAVVDLARVPLPVAHAPDRLGTWMPGRDLAEAAPGRAVGLAQQGFIPLVRAVTEASGSVVFVVAALNPDHFAGAYALLLADPSRDAALFSFDGAMLAATERIRLAPGQSAAQHRFFREVLPARESGSFIGAGIDGAQVVTAFRLLRNRPLAVIVERRYDSVSGELATIAGWVAGACGLALSSMGVLIVLARRSLHSHAAVRHALDAAHEKLASQLGFTARLLDVSPTPLFVKDGQGRFVTVNRAWLDLMGFELAQVVGRDSTDLFGAEAPLHHDHDHRLLRSDVPVSYENRLKRPHREDRDTVVTKVRFDQPDGQPAGMVGSIIDVTEFREAERRTREAQHLAERANSAKSEFIANISHELRTPLQAILGFSELGAALASGQLPFHELFSDIQAGGQRMLTLVNGLLDVSQLDGEMGSLERQRSDVAALLRALLSPLQPASSARGLQLALQGSSEPLWADVDAARFQQAMHNVIANAIRFAPIGSQVDIEAADCGPAGIELRVRDHGPGIPESEVETIFEAFVQSSRTRDGAGGTGLGLTISRKILRAHGGSISASNAPGGGALICVCLPASSAAAPSRDVAVCHESEVF